MLSVLMAGCAKESNSTTTAAAAAQYGVVNGSCYNYTSGVYVLSSYCSSLTATTNSGYTYSNGYCYSTSTGQVVDTSYCSSTTAASGYTYYNGYCYSTSTGQQVNTSYCSSATGGTTNGACYGTYIYNYNGYAQYVTCSGSNCRGYTLIQTTTGQQVYCQ